MAWWPPWCASPPLECGPSFPAYLQARIVCGVKHVSGDAAAVVCRASGCTFVPPRCHPEAVALPSNLCCSQTVARARNLCAQKYRKGPACRNTAGCGWRRPQTHFPWEYAGMSPCRPVPVSHQACKFSTLQGKAFSDAAEPAQPAVLDARSAQEAGGEAAPSSATRTDATPTDNGTGSQNAPQLQQEGPSGSAAEGRHSDAAHATTDMGEAARPMSAPGRAVTSASASRQGSPRIAHSSRTVSAAARRAHTPRNIVVAAGDDAKIVTLTQVCSCATRQDRAGARTLQLSLTQPRPSSVVA